MPCGGLSPPGEFMAHLKKCPHCKGTHRKRSQFLKCKRAHHMETWS